ncbi:MAG: hypothetical protein HPY53_02990 [Brevinematales bacterium]|nr:hypothetical protein [Brevinematales bacterium]
MKKFTMSILFMAAVGVALVSCGGTAVKPGDGGQTNTTVGKTNAVVQPQNTVKDKFDDTAYKNVIAVLKAALSAEKSNPTALTKLDSGKALALVAKFLKENIKEPKYGFTPEDIETYKGAAMKKFKDVVSDPTAGKETKDKANAEMSKLNNI